MGRRNNRERLTPEQRHQFKLEREKMVSELVDVEHFKRCIVVEHIRGSQYQLYTAAGKVIYASHSKNHGWKLWEERI